MSTPTPAAAADPALADIAHSIADDIAQVRPHRSQAGAIGDDLKRAYAVQDEVVARLLDLGHRTALAGYKVALNNPALMQKFGVSEPVSARIFIDQHCDSGADLSGRRFLQFAFEPEIAALIDRTLPLQGAPYDRARVAGFVQRLVPALELLDQRQINMSTPRVTDVIAQNISNAGIAVGGPGVTPAEFDALQVTTTVELDGQATAQVVNGAPQHPLDVVAWMANHLAARGLQLEAGMVVLCGTHTPIQHPGTARHIRVAMKGLGDVQVRL